MDRNSTARTEARRDTEYLYLALELAAAKWQLAASDGGQTILEHMLAPGDGHALVEWLDRTREVLELPQGAPTRSCHEAGRDGFWVHRFLERLEIRNVVVDPSSVKVDRRQRRRKTDRLDARRLLADLVRYHNGEPHVWSVCVPPSAAQEDNRRLHRELERLKKERMQHRVRIQSLLATQGARAKSVNQALKDSAGLAGGAVNRSPRRSRRRSNVRASDCRS